MYALGYSNVGGKMRRRENTGHSIIIMMCQGYICRAYRWPASLGWPRFDVGVRSCFISAVSSLHCVFLFCNHCYRERQLAEFHTVHYNQESKEKETMADLDYNYTVDRQYKWGHVASSGCTMRRTMDLTMDRGQ